MENKKISFGFSKTKKRTEIISKAPKPEKQLELIDCLEGQSIKIKDAVEEIKQPLVIPIKNSSKNLIDRIKEAKEKRVKVEVTDETIPPDSALPIDELAARELIREAQNRDTIKTETKVFTLPLTEDKFIAEGENEPSLEDYESVPISDYGMAMLRGMGWKEGMPIGKTHSKTVLPILPELRPKGLGLGANKMVNANKPTQSLDKDGKELQLVKGAYGKIIAGTHKGVYCQVQGLDDDNCRIIVKTAMTNNVLSLNEFLIVPVTKEEYAVGSKVINNAKYEEYKNKSLKKERSTSRERSRSPLNKIKKNKSHKKRVTSESENECRNENKSDHNNKEVEGQRSKSKKIKKKSKKARNRSRSRDYDKKRKSKKKSKSRHKSSDDEYDTNRTSGGPTKR